MATSTGLPNQRLQLAPTPSLWLAAQLLASLARAAVWRRLAWWRDFSVVGAAEARYVGRTMEEIRYAPSLPRLVRIVAVLAAPFAAFLWAEPFHLLAAVVLIAASVYYAGRAHAVMLGPDFIAAHGQRVRLSDIRSGEAIRGFIGDVYTSDSTRIGVSSIFLSQEQRSEIARRLAQSQSL